MSLSKSKRGEHAASASAPSGCAVSRMAAGSSLCRLLVIEEATELICRLMLAADSRDKRCRHQGGEEQARRATCEAGTV